MLRILVICLDTICTLLLSGSSEARSLGGCMLAAGVYVNYLSPTDSSKRISREMTMWSKVIKDANVKAD